MDKQTKMTIARDAARDTYASETLHLQAIAALASLATKGTLPKYVRDEYQQGLIDCRLHDDPVPSAVEIVEGESDAQYDARVVKAQRKHGRKIAAWARKRVSRAMTALEKDHGIDVPRDARGGADNAKKAEQVESETTGDDDEASKGADERRPLKTGKAALQSSVDNLAAAIGQRNDTDLKAEALAGLENIAAFLDLNLER